MFIKRGVWCFMENSIGGINWQQQIFYIKVGIFGF